MAGAVAVLKQMYDFICKHPRFTRAGSGNYKLRAAEIFYGGALCFVEFAEIA